MSARSLNKVMLIGNLTRDPNMRYTPNNNTPVCSFGLATNRDWMDEGGARQERTEFHNLVAWSKLAEICGQILHKGDKVYVDGRMQTRDWKADDGSQRRTTEIVLENMILLRSVQGRSESEASYMSEIEATGASQEDVLVDQMPEVEEVAEEVAAEVAEEAAEEKANEDDIPF
ncbi:single-stranded DNA-binding protein [Microgenomates group bacterium]|nr:single-stranded DNA-binding protein [Microgenomates group bacterium]